MVDAILRPDPLADRIDGGVTTMAWATNSKVSRREAFRLAGLTTAGIGFAQWLPAAASGSVTGQGVITSPDEALRALMEGNQRWVSAQTMHPDQSVERRTQLASGQQPFAVVFSCV